MGSPSVALAVREAPIGGAGAAGRVAFLLVVVVIGILAIAFQFLTVRALYGDVNSSAQEGKTNCPSCGARIPDEADACEYCGEPV